VNIVIVIIADIIIISFNIVAVSIVIINIIIQLIIILMTVTIVNIMTGIRTMTSAPSSVGLLSSGEREGWSYVRICPNLRVGGIIIYCIVFVNIRGCFQEIWGREFIFAKRYAFPRLTG